MIVYISNDRLALTDKEIWQFYITGPGSAEEITKDSIKTGEFKAPLSMMRKICLVILLAFYRILSIYYHVTYFYFAPF